jgi:outer membrane protein assembly factor BamD (BamD/ComL family)
MARFLDARGATRATVRTFVVGITLLLAACHAPLWKRPFADTDPAAELVAQADGLARDGKSKAAARLYEQAAREYPHDPAAAGALHGLGLLQVDPKSSIRDYRAARSTYDQLLTGYPDSPWTAEARSWQAVLQELEHRDAETARLRSDLERLKALDIDMERRR